MNSIDSITQLRAKQNAGEHFIGIDVINGTIADFEKLGIIEPLNVKEKIIKSATETANIILRIDNVIAVSCSASTEPPQGMPTGGGMY
jgi:chaperonin GroEL (HSP60 family)